MKKLISILILFLVVGLWNCSEEKAEAVKREKQSLSRVLELRQLAKQEVTSRGISGGMFFAIGGFHSSESRDLFVNAFVKTERGFQYFQIPFSKIRININNELEKPHLELILHEDAVGYTSDKIVLSSRYDWKYEVAVIHCPEKYLPERLLPIEL